MVDNMDDKKVREAWSKLVRATIGDMSRGEVAERVGVSVSAIDNWVNAKNYKRPDGYNAFRFAKAFGLPVPDTLMVVGIGDEEDYSGEIIVKPDISAFTKKEMLEEIMRRESEESSPKEEPRAAGATKLRLAPEVKEGRQAKSEARLTKLSRAKGHSPL